MGGDFYNILIFHKEASAIRRYRLPRFLAKLILFFIPIFFISLGYFVFDYIIVRQQVTELDRLREETQLQRSRIHLFSEKIGDASLTYMAHHQLALIAMDAGERERARSHFQKAFHVIDSIAEGAGETREAFLQKPHVEAVFQDAQRL